MADKVESGAGGAVPRALPDSTDTSPPSRDTHAKTVPSEMEEVKGEMTQMTQRVERMEARFQSGLYELSTVMEDIRKALGIKPEPMPAEVRVKREEETLASLMLATEPDIEPGLETQPEVEPLLATPVPEVEPEPERVNVVHADVVGSPTSGKPNRDILKKLPEYNGDIPWEDYFSQFKILRFAYDWNDDEAALYLIASLRGPATSVLSNVPSRKGAGYTVITQALQRRFGKSFTTEVYKARLKARYRKKGESLSQLAQDIETLVHRSYSVIRYVPAPPVLIEDLAKDHFIRALNEREIQLYVMQAHPRTLSEALASALEYESFMQVTAKEDKSCPKPNNNHTPENKLPYWKTRTSENRVNPPRENSVNPRPVTPLVRARPARERPQQPPAQTGFTGVCWMCGERGHRRDQCPRENVNNRGRPAGGQGQPGRNNRGAVPRPQPPPPQRPGNGGALAGDASAWPVEN